MNVRGFLIALLIAAPQVAHAQSCSVSGADAYSMTVDCSDPVNRASLKAAATALFEAVATAEFADPSGYANITAGAYTSNSPFTFMATLVAPNVTLGSFLEEAITFSGTASSGYSAALANVSATIITTSGNVYTPSYSGGGATVQLTGGALAAPGPIAGAGAPALLAFAGALGLLLRRSKISRSSSSSVKA